MAVGISPEGRVNDGEIFFGNGLWIVAVLFVEAFFESIVHGVNGSFSVFVTFESVNVGFLDEKEDKKESGECSDDDDF